MLLTLSALVQMRTTIIGRRINEDRLDNYEFFMTTTLYVFVVAALMAPASVEAAGCAYCAEHCCYDGICLMGCW